MSDRQYYTREEEVLAELDQIYAEMKFAQTGRKREDLTYMAPEQRPAISSTQIKALVALLVQKGVL